MEGVKKLARLQHDFIATVQPQNVKFAGNNMAEGARFEAATVSETIELDRISLVRSQSLTEESEADQEPVKPDRTR